MRTGEMKFVPVWVRFGLSDRSEKSGRPEILMQTEFFFRSGRNESCECHCGSDIVPLGASLIVWLFVCFTPVV